MDGENLDWLRERITELSNVPVPDKLEIVTDTSEFMGIYRGQVLRMDNKHFLITGNVYESRFSIADQPVYWVKKAIDLESGTRQILKLVYFEEFIANVGPLRIRCYRKPSKEGRVLELVRSHPRFMQGRSLFDRRGNEVRAIDYIPGPDLYSMVLGMNMPHEEYFHTVCPGILRKLGECFSGIQYLHDHGLCHGDIRSDHILIEQETGEYIWIDFDLVQDFSDFDVWSVGNVLQFCIGMGMNTFHEVLGSDSFPEWIKNEISSDDASAFHKNRIINLRKLFPHIPERLNDILLHFAENTSMFYDSVDQIVTDLEEALEELPAS